MDYNKAVFMKHELQVDRHKVENHANRPDIFLILRLLDLEISRFGEIDYVYAESEKWKENQKFPLVGQYMSDLPSIFCLRHAIDTENFIHRLESELKLFNPLDCTMEFLKKVLAYAVVYLKKQRVSESAIFGPKDCQKVVMDFKTAIAMRDVLLKELDLIKARSSDLPILMRFLKAEVVRLNREIDNVSHTMKESDDDIRVPAEGASLLSRVPDEYKLSSATEIKKFIRTLYSEFKILSDFPALTLTVKLIHKVIGYAETYMMEKKPFEFGEDDD